MIKRLLVTLSILVAFALIVFCIEVFTPYIIFVSTKDNASACKSVLEGDTYTTLEDMVTLPLTCIAEVRQGDKKFNFEFRKDGSFEVFDGSKNILKLKSFYENIDESLSGDDDNLVDILYSIESEGPVQLVHNAIYFVDVNFDDYKDIILRSNSGIYNFTYNIYTYHPDTMLFDKTPYMSHLVNPEFHREAKVIVTHNLGRGIGDIYSDNTWHFENGKYIVVMSEEQDVIDNDVIPLQYRKVIREIVNGKLATTSDEVYTVDN